MSNHITVRLASGKSFAKGLKYAKQWGGRFDPASKTWDIPVAKMGDAVNAPQLYGLIPVKSISTQHDHNCPARFGGACECDVQTGA